MGVSLGDCEYAYQKRISIDSNQPVKTTVDDGNGNESYVIQYRHQVDISYERLDVNKALLEYAVRTHYTDLTDVMDNIFDAKNKIDAATWEWIREDKIVLSGFDMGPQP